MTLLSIICGVFMIVAGIICMATPLATFLSTGYFCTVLFLIYGIVGIVRFIQKQASGLVLAVSILAVIVGLVSLFRPGQSLVFDAIVLYMIAAWLFIQGGVTLFMSIQARDYTSGWGWGVAVGILGMIAGIYSLAHPMVTAVTAGVLIGIYFIETGFNMIVLGSALGAVNDSMH